VPSVPFAGRLVNTTDLWQTASAVRPATTPGLGRRWRLRCRRVLVPRRLDEEEQLVGIDTFATRSVYDRYLREAVKVGGWARAALWFSSRSSGWVKPPPRGERHYDHENFSGKERGDEWLWCAAE
jgi:hypothetical protein